MSANSIVGLSAFVLTPEGQAEFDPLNTFLYRVESGSVEVSSTERPEDEGSVYTDGEHFCIEGAHRIRSVTAMATVCRVVTTTATSKPGAAGALPFPPVTFDNQKRKRETPMSKAAHSTSNDDPALNERIDRHRAYIVDCKEQLERNLHRTPSNLSRISTALTLLPHDQTAARARIELEFNTTMQDLGRRALVFKEASEFKDISEESAKHRLVPWCTNSCKYCCMARQDWESHVRHTYTSMRSTFLDLEERERRTIEECGATIFSDFNAALSLETLRDGAQTIQRNLERERETTWRNDILREEEYSWAADVVLPWAAVIKSVKDFDEKMALRERHLQVLRIQDSLGLQERRVLRQQLVLAVEEERMARRQLGTLEEVKRGQLAVRVGEVVNAAKIQSVQEEMRQLVSQRDELVEYQGQKIREEENAVSEQAKQAQAELVEEFKEIKRLKKAGAEKNPPPVPCPKCGQPPIKDLFTHRLSECPDRPAQCTKCEAIMKFAVFDDHKSKCPARVVQCPSCNNHYKAQHLEEAHNTNCLRIQHARQLVQSMQPVNSIEFIPASPDAPDAMVVGVAAAIPLSSLTPTSVSQLASTATPVSSRPTTRPTTQQEDSENEASGAGLNSSNVSRSSAVFSPTDKKELVRRIVKLDETPVSSAEEIVRYIESRSVSDVVDVECSDGLPFKLTVGTTIPMSEFRGLMLMVREDEAQFCKPEPKKKGGSAKKR